MEEGMREKREGLERHALHSKVTNGITRLANLGTHGTEVIRETPDFKELNYTNMG